MSDSYPCPHCKPFVPFRNKESLFVHLQREHNLNVLDATELCESLDGKSKTTLDYIDLIDERVI